MKKRRPSISGRKSRDHIPLRLSIPPQVRESLRGPLQAILNAPEGDEFRARAEAILRHGIKASKKARVNAELGKLIAASKAAPHNASGQAELSEMGGAPREISSSAHDNPVDDVSIKAGIRSGEGDETQSSEIDPIMSIPPEAIDSVGVVSEKKNWPAREITPAGVALPTRRITISKRPVFPPQSPRIIFAGMALVAAIIGRGTTRETDQRNNDSHVKVKTTLDAGTITDAAYVDTRPDITTSPVSVPVLASTPRVEHVETPIIYNWKFARPKPPGYQNACIQGAVMSVLIGEFAMPMNNLYTNAVAHRAEVALKAARGANIHTQENTDFIATSYHQDRGVIVVAQMRTGNSQPLGIAIVNLRDQPNTLPVGFNLDAARASVSSAWLQHGH